MTIVSATVMELCHWPIWNEWFPEKFGRHYSEVDFFSDEKIASLDKLNLAKALITSYCIVFALLLRISHLIVLPVVALAGSVCFLTQHLKAAAKRPQSVQGSHENAAGQVEDSAKKQLNSD